MIETLDKAKWNLKELYSSLKGNASNLAVYRILQEKDKHCVLVYEGSFGDCYEWLIAVDEKVSRERRNKRVVTDSTIPF